MFGKLFENLKLRVDNSKQRFRETILAVLAQRRNQPDYLYNYNYNTTSKRD